MARNPMLSESAFERAHNEQVHPAHVSSQDEFMEQQGFVPNYRTAASSQVMTLQGTINKTFVLLMLCALGGFIGWTKAASMLSGAWMLLTIGGFILAIWTSFSPKVSSFTSPIYALIEGLLLGVISAAYNAEFPGIVLSAVLITGIVFFVMLFLYKTGIVKVTQGFATAIVSATFAIALMYLGSWIFSLFGGNISYLTSSSPLSIVISVVICLVAAFNLMLDFQFISVMASRPETPKYMEWYAGFGLLVTIVWLYIEILKLLGKSKRR